MLQNVRKSVVAAQVKLTAARATKVDAPAYKAPKLFVGGNTLDLVQRVYNARYYDYGYRSSWQ